MMKRMTVVLASRNKGKVRELEKLLCEYLGDVIELKSLTEVGITEEIEENGTTFEENAFIKASAAAKSGFPGLGDDSGLVVRALDMAPGVYSARYAGEHGNDAANNDKLLFNLKNVPDEKRTARFVCAICVSFPDGSEITAEGACEGKIGYEYRGNNGFGYDPLFMVGDKSFAELSAEEKDAVSHRGNALKKLKELLPTV